MSVQFLWRAYKTRFRDQRAEIRELISAIKPGEIAVDVGSHKGSYLYWLAKAAAPGQVVAFEPQPTLAEYLRRECAAARLKNVVVESAGVSDHNGELTLHVPGTSTSHGASFEDIVLSIRKCQSFSVPVYKLDDYFRNRTSRIAALKIDVEGHEFSVLRGAQELLRRDAPCLVVECEARRLTTCSVQDVLSYLQSLGFSGSFVDQGRLRPVSEFDPTKHQRMKGDRFWDAPDYCGNFVLTRNVA